MQLTFRSIEGMSRCILVHSQRYKKKASAVGYRGIKSFYHRQQTDDSDSNLM